MSWPHWNFVSRKDGWRGVWRALCHPILPKVVDGHRNDPRSGRLGQISYDVLYQKKEKKVLFDVFHYGGAHTAVY